MTSRYESRPAGAFGTKLDLSAFAPVGISLDDNWLVESPDGRFAVINSEGVGMIFDPLKDEMASVWGTSPMSIFEHDMPVADILAAMGNTLDVDAEKTDLRDIVRIFGDRLDMNHGIWYRFATEGK